MVRILITGGSGFVGSALKVCLEGEGVEVVNLSRRAKGGTEMGWNPETGALDAGRLEGFDGVVHLAGENIAAGRWSAARKQAILNSRVQGTRLLASALAGLKARPRVLVSASAIGIYGDRGDEKLTESSSAGDGFLAEVCRQWEAETRVAEEAGIRVVHARLGLVLDPSGGVLQRMMMPFKLGVAGALGDGRQFMSWISLADLVSGLTWALTHDACRGAVNMVSPNPVTNQEFTSAMRQALIPAYLPMRYWTPPAPAAVLRAVLGEMADALLLSSQRVYPVVLGKEGMVFQHPEIKRFLKEVV